MLSSQNIFSHKTSTSLSQCWVVQLYPSLYWVWFLKFSLGLILKLRRILIKEFSMEVASGLGSFQVKFTSVVIPIIKAVTLAIDLAYWAIQAMAQQWIVHMQTVLTSTSVNVSSNTTSFSGSFRNFSMNYKALHLHSRQEPQNWCTFSGSILSLSARAKCC